MYPGWSSKGGWKVVRGRFDDVLGIIGSGREMGRLQFGYDRVLSEAPCGVSTW